MQLRAITVTLVADPNNQHANHLRRMRRAYFGWPEVVQVQGALTSKQRRVIEIFRKYGDCAYTEAA